MSVDLFIRKIVVLVLVFLALLFFLALASYHPDDVSILNQRAAGAYEAPRNLVGTVGASVAAVCFQLVGTAAFVLVALFGVFIYHHARRLEAPLARAQVVLKVAGSALFLLFFPALLGLLLPDIPWRGTRLLTGGLLGQGLARVLSEGLGFWGSRLACIFLAALGGMLFFVWIPGHAPAPGGGAWTAFRERLTLWFYRWRHRKTERRIADKILRAEEAGPSPVPPGSLEEELGHPLAAASKAEAGPKRPTRTPRPKAPAAEPAQQRLLPVPSEGYTLPNPALLDPPEQLPRENNRILMDMGKAIEAKFGEFQVTGSVESIHPGPVVTTFEFKPNEGIKLTRMLALQDDLALALKAEAVRIDRIPGKGTVGIEVPNPNREVIALREIIESPAYKDSKSPLTIALGKDIHGAPVVESLAKMPHLLIAGSTGQGKSVAMNSLLMSILFKAGPDEVKLILIDPKKVEFSIYEDIPHLCAPIITSPKRAAASLQWALVELETRSRKLKEVQARDIEAYNHTVRTRGEGEPLPYIVIFIDELADLMMQLRKEIEDSIARLAQMARAVGIHLVMATQRPSTDIITGIIKANFPTRIAFAVVSKVDSRVILDDNGAEKLLGRGDMLMLTSTSSRLRRLHGSFVSSPEISRVVKFLKAQKRPDYIEAVVALQTKAEASPEGEADESDPLFGEAVRTVLTTKIASATFLQRKLRVGYAKASRLLDVMEQKGWIGPTQGAKPREILLSKEETERLLAQLENGGFDAPPDE
jgi:S-DNA-T family DNA segregation ATPase FtsK/SpoIIIE